MITFLRLLALALAAAPLMANGDQCGMSRSGCLYGWHDCRLKPGHTGRHRCGNCGDSF